MDVVVIGGGPAGVTAALRAKELGTNVTLLERKRLGGTCTNDGCVPTRVLARAARLAREAKKFRQFGLISEPPMVDFAHLIQYSQEVVEQIHQKKRIEDHLSESGVELVYTPEGARFVDAHTVEYGNGQRIQADRFIITAGGHTRRVEFEGSQHAIYVQDVWNLKSLPKSIAIVGGAATGCQVASILAALGTKVHLLEVSPRILRLEDPLTSRIIHRAFTEMGIDVIAGIGGLSRIEKEADGLRLLYHKADQIEELSVESVLLAIGWVGNIEGLNLEAAGVEVERSYVKVDDTLQSSVPHIYAAGDITGKMMLVQSGSLEGRIAAENAILGPASRIHHSIVPHGGFTDPEYGSVGLSEEEANRQNVDYVTAVTPYADMDRAIIDHEPEGFCKLLVSRETHRIIGAHVVGEQAVEVIQLVAAGMASDVWVEQLAELELAYPTYSAVVGLTARKIVNELGVMPMSAQWRTLNRPLASEWERGSTDEAQIIHESQTELARQFASD